MSRAAILYDNLADRGVITASSWLASAPPSLLKNQHVSRRWCGRNGTDEYVLIDLGAAAAVDTIAFFGTQAIVGGVQENMSAAAVTRIRVSTVDASGLTGDAHDSGSVTAVSNKHGCLISLLASPVTGRYVRLDITQPTASALLAGRAVIGRRNVFSINFEYGWSADYEDLSRAATSAAGLTFIERDDRIRTLNLSFGFMSDAERYGFIEEMNRLNGVSRDILFIIDPESADPARDSIWGLKEKSAVTNPLFDVFAMPITIRERR